MRRILVRMRAACRTNDTQCTTVLLMSVLTVNAMSRNATISSAPWWSWLVAAGLWPLIAYLANLCDPIP